MEKMVKVCIVGCGGMARQYLSVYRDLDWVHVSACVDTVPERARSAAASVGADKATTEFQAALSDGIDAVIINTPNHVHRSQAIAAIEAGKHVLLQKPVAANLADAEAIARAAQNSNQTIGLYMSYFDNPLLHDLRNLIEEGYLGDLVHFYGRFMHHGGMISSAEALNGNRTWRASLEQTGGGCFIQLAVHYIRMFEWFSNSSPVRVSAATRNLHSPGIEGEDLACALLELESGALATMDTAWCANGEQLAIHGTLGRIEYRNNRVLSVSSSKGPYNGPVISYGGAKETAFDGVHGVEELQEVCPPACGDGANVFNQHRVFLESVRDGKPAFCSIAAGVRDLRCVHAAYESARTGRPVEVGPGSTKDSVAVGYCR